jgi:hypothetical protein
LAPGVFDANREPFSTCAWDKFLYTNNQVVRLSGLAVDQPGPTSNKADREVLKMLSKLASVDGKSMEFPKNLGII